MSRWLFFICRLNPIALNMTSYKDKKATNSQKLMQPDHAAAQCYGVQDCLHIVTAAEECDATGQIVAQQPG